jgi:signal transduction histidine kinase
VRAAGLHLQVDVPPHLPAVAVNADSMRMAVRNLLDNAIKYTPAGGRVSIQSSVISDQLSVVDDQVGTDDKLITDHCSLLTDHWLLMTVTDTGPGIPAEHLPRIFDRFYRVDKTRSRRQGGAGLGLSLVRSIVEAHGGQASVQSTPGEGSIFAIRLPTRSKYPISNL